VVATLWLHYIRLEQQETREEKRKEKKKEKKRDETN